MKLFNHIEKSYSQLLQDLNSDNLPVSVSKLAKAYFSFTKTIAESFLEKDFSFIPKAWNTFEVYFETKPFNAISLGLYIGDMDFSTRKSYLEFLLQCQQFIATEILSTFVYDLPLYEKNKQLLPPSILFSQWLNKPHDTLKSYFKDFSQEHFNLLGSFNHLPEFESFINTLFLRSKKEYDKNSFDNDYFLFHLENLQLVKDKGIYADVLLKNNQLQLPEDFIDYIKLCVKKLSDKPSQQQSQLEQKELQEFFITYQKQKFEYLFPAKNIKTKINKI